MRALLLTAGLGTRLRPLTYVRAKAAVPVNGEAIARRAIAWLARHGVTECVLNLHHQPASIAAVTGDGADLGIRVRYSWENPVLGSAGGPRHALPLLTDTGSPGADDDLFLVVNGDTLTDFPLEDLAAAHRASGALVTMALTRNPRPDVYGGVVVQGGRVRGFSRPGGAGESFHFIGVQAASPRAFERLEDGVPAESVMQLYPALMRDDADAIAAHVVDAPFSDVGSPADYLETSLALAAREGDRLVSATGVRIDPSARLSRTAVWDHVTICAHAELDSCIVADGAVIPAGSRFSRAAIVPAGALRGAPAAGERIEGALLVRNL